MKDGGSSAFHKIPMIVVVSVQFPFSNLKSFFLTLASPFCSCCYLFPMIGCPSFGLFSRFTPVNCQHNMENNHVTFKIEDPLVAAYRSHQSISFNCQSSDSTWIITYRLPSFQIFYSACNKIPKKPFELFCQQPLSVLNCDRHNQ